MQDSGTTAGVICVVMCALLHDHQNAANGMTLPGQGEDWIVRRSGGGEYTIRGRDLGPGGYVELSLDDAGELVEARTYSNGSRIRHDLRLGIEGDYAYAHGERREVHFPDGKEEGIFYRVLSGSTEGHPKYDHKLWVWWRGGPPYRDMDSPIRRIIYDVPDSASCRKAKKACTHFVLTYAEDATKVLQELGQVGYTRYVREYDYGGRLLRVRTQNILRRTLVIVASVLSAIACVVALLQAIIQRL